MKKKNCGCKEKLQKIRKKKRMKEWEGGPGRTGSWPGWLWCGLEAKAHTVRSGLGFGSGHQGISSWRCRDADVFIFKWWWWWYDHHHMLGWLYCISNRLQALRTSVLSCNLTTVGARTAWGFYKWVRCCLWVDKCLGCRWCTV